MITTKRRLIALQLAAFVPQSSLGYVDDLQNDQCSESKILDSLSQIRKFNPILADDYQIEMVSEFCVVTPKGVDWGGHSPADRSVYRACDGSAMVLRAVDITCQDLVDWNVSESRSQNASEFHCRREGEAGL